MQLSGDQRFVFVIVDGKAQRRAVTLGVDGGTFWKSSVGLKTDDSIVVAGIDALADGSPVRTQSGTTPWQPTTAKTDAEPARPPGAVPN